ncbi:TonB-dependent receptor [Escherichia albertii]|nr:TonB-dependent receptor [Escherichia albertii]WDB90487.1 TonB-dependent receptor [Escherichia albertii]
MPGTFYFSNPQYVDKPDYEVGEKSKVNYTDNEYISFILSDNIKFNEQWSVLAGVNFTRDEFKTYNLNNGDIASNYDKTRPTPTLALMYKPIPIVTTYISYVEAIEQGGFAPDLYNGHDVTNAGEMMAPMVTRQVNIKGIFIHANATPCANHCRYCQLTSSRPRKISIERYAALIHRFLDWKEQSNPHFEIHPWFGNSYDHDISVVKIIRQIENRLDNRCKNFLLGGLSHRSLNEMRQWIAERHQQGLDTLVATFSGYQKDHNYWNNYPDNYQFQLDCLRLAASMGLKTQQRILLLRSSLSSLESVLDDLDSIQPHIRERWAIPRLC